MTATRTAAAAQMAMDAALGRKADNMSGKLLTGISVLPGEAGGVLTCSPPLNVTQCTRSRILVRYAPSLLRMTTLTLDLISKHPMLADTTGSCLHSFEYAHVI